MNRDTDTDEDFSFAPGELESLILEGERSIMEEGTLDVDAAFQERERQRQELRSKME